MEKRRRTKSGSGDGDEDDTAVQGGEAAASILRGQLLPSIAFVSPLICCL